VGTFNGLPEGAQFTLNNGTVSQLFQITYVGGDGNDIVLTRLNTPPVLTPPANQTTNEGALTTFQLGSFTDVDPNQPFMVTVNWGDGTPLIETFTVQGPGAITRDHTYPDNGVFTVQVTVADPNGGSDTKSFQVTVNNVAPSTLVLNTTPNPSDE